MKKVFLITGGSSGIGYQIVKKLSKKNVAIILARKASSTDLVNNYSIFGIDTDIRSINNISKALEEITGNLNIKKIDGIINCAGIAYDKRLQDVTEEDYRDIFETNVKGLIFSTKIFLDILKNDTGIICNISSIAGIKGFSNWSIYSASKFAVEGFTQSIKHELRDRGIRVMSVRPGSIDTNIYKKLSTKEKSGFIKPQTIANIVVELLQLPKEATVEEIFINNSIGDL